MRTFRNRYAPGGPAPGSAPVPAEAATVARRNPTMNSRMPLMKHSASWGHTNARLTRARVLRVKVRERDGAGNETRTRDPDLGKVVLYQLSYSRVREIRSREFYVHPLGSQGESRRARRFTVDRQLIY